MTIPKTVNSICLIAFAGIFLRVFLNATSQRKKSLSPIGDKYKVKRNQQNNIGTNVECLQAKLVFLWIGNKFVVNFICYTKRNCSIILEYSITNLIREDGLDFTPFLVK